MRSFSIGAWWPYLLVTAIVLLLRWPTLANRILSIDDASYLVHALRLDSFEAFIYAFNYRVETKIQVGLLPYLLADAISRENAIFLINLFGLVLVVVGCSLLIAISRRFLGGAVPGLVAGIAWSVYLVVGPGSPVPYDPAEYEFFQAARLEYFQSPLLFLSLYWFLLGAERVRAGGEAGRLSAGAGMAWAVACLVKPSAALFGPLLLAALPFFWSRAVRAHRSIARLGRPVGAFVLGAAAPVILTFAPYLFHPEALAELQFSLFEVGGHYVEGGDRLSRRALDLLAGIPLFLLVAFLLLPLLLLTFAAYFKKREQTVSRVPGVTALLVFAAGALFVGVLPGQAHLYYLVPVIPFMALAVSGGLALLFRRVANGGRSSSLLTWGIALALAVGYLAPQAVALVSYPARTLNDAYLGRDRRRFDLDGLVAHIKATTPPDAKLWVYYNTPELILLSGRLPATRDPAGIWLNYVWKEPWFQRITAELAEECPHLIIGIDRPRYHYPHTTPLLEVPTVGRWIASSYDCDAKTFRGATVCSRVGGCRVP